MLRSRKPRPAGPSLALLVTVIGLPPGQPICLWRA
jgi:hypothetical protein